jgi:hypothetical protein
VSSNLCTCVYLLIGICLGCCGRRVWILRPSRRREMSRLDTQGQQASYLAGTLSVLIRLPHPICACGKVDGALTMHE